METKRVTLAGFGDFDITPTNVLPWQPYVFPKFFFVEKELSKYMLIRSNFAELVTYYVLVTQHE